MAVSPDLSTLYQAAASAHVSPTDAVVEAVGGRAHEVAALEAELIELEDEIAAREKDRSLIFPDIYRVGDAGMVFLYALMRVLRPTTVVETGVADGHSSLAILRALMANGGGRLVSVDIRPDAGALLDPAEREHWTLHLVDEAAPRDALRRALADAGQVGVFIHDSLHTYRWQMFELETARRCMGPGGFVVCDDADDSFAFIDFCARISTRPVLLVQPFKVLGVTPCPAAPNL